jgi:hypothetical protein
MVAIGGWSQISRKLPYNGIILDYPDLNIHPDIGREATNP